MGSEKKSFVIELPQTESRIGAKTVHIGNLKFQRSLSIFGKVEGQILGGDLLVIHPESEVNADIEVDYLLLAGTVKGTIKARKGICLYSGSVFKGSILSDVMRMHVGADFEGSCNLLEKKRVDIFDLSRGEFRAMLTDSRSSENVPYM